MRSPGTQIGREINRHGFGYEPRTDIKLKDALPALGGEPGLFQQFAFCGFELIFALVDTSCGKLPKKLLSGMTILALKQNPGSRAIFLNGKNHDRTRVVDYIASDANSRWFEYFIGRNPERRSPVSFF